MKPLPNPPSVEGSITKSTPAGHARAAPHLLGRRFPADAALQDEQQSGRSKAFGWDSAIREAWAAATKVGSVPIVHRLPVVFPSASPSSQGEANTTGPK